MGSTIPKEIKYNLHYDDVWGDFLRPPQTCCRQVEKFSAVPVLYSASTAVYHTAIQCIYQNETVYETGLIKKKIIIKIADSAGWSLFMRPIVNEF